MAKIRILDENVVNQIAAGEVVERPAAVLKELVENALDAAATEISVELTAGGLGEIVVRDNGCGMTADDAPLALARHATSKISAIDDLYQLTTMGFRGEALASIASVSRFSLATRVATSAQGCEVVAGNPHRVQPWGGGPGTEVRVRELFFNVAARRKFVRSEAAEFAACNEWLQAIAFSRPHVGFRLTHNGQEKWLAPALESRAAMDRWGYPLLSEAAMRQRLAVIWPREATEVLLFVEQENDFGRVQMLLSAPGQEKAVARYQLGYVNGRWVRDKVLKFGIQRGYHSHLLKGRHPLTAAWFCCDPGLVDVNVHPTKTEVRFQYPSEVQGLLAQAITRRLREADWAATAAHSPAAFADASPPVPAPRSKVRPAPEAAATPPWRPPTVPQPYPLAPQTAAPQTARLPFAAPASAAPPSPTEPPWGTAPPCQPTSRTVPWPELTYRGQWLSGYLIFEGGGQVVVADQHAMHERILYEQLRHHRDTLCEPQRLLVPEVLHLDPSTGVNVERHRPALSQLGFELTWAQPHTVLEVRAVPSLLMGRAVEAFLAACPSPDLGAADRTSLAEELTHDILAQLACHSAVRAGEPMTAADVTRLLSEAADVDFFHNCPHGRRVLRVFTQRQVEAWFDRI